MARISGVNIPTNKKVNIALTYIFGIGNKIANEICNNASIDITKRVSELSEEDINKIQLAARNALKDRLRNIEVDDNEDDFEEDSEEKLS